MKIEEKIKYYGKVWFPVYPEDQKFAVLTIIGSKFEIETDLTPFKSSKDLSQKYFNILGIFNGLGKVSFFNAIPKHGNFGAIDMYKFTSTNNHEKKSFMITGILLKEKEQSLDISILEKIGGVEFYIQDDTIRNWLHNSLREEIPDSVAEFKIIDAKKVSIPFSNITNDNFNVEILQGFNSRWQTYKFNIQNKGGIKFKFKEEVTILELLNKYKLLKMTLKFLFNTSFKFEFIEIKPLNSDEWLRFYWEDIDMANYASISVGAYYDDLGEDIVKCILNKIFSNKDHEVIIKTLIRNYILPDLDDEYRFASSIRVLEGFYKRFKKEQVEKYYKNKPKGFIDLGYMLSYYKTHFQKITENKLKDWENFEQTLLNTRNSFIHFNTDQELQNKCDSNENYCAYFIKNILMNLSFLIDYVVGYLILLELLDESKKSKSIIEKYVKKWNSDFAYILDELLDKKSKKYLK